MPRPPRPLVLDGTYHVYSRSRPDVDLLATDAERRMFLSIAAKVIRQHRWTCLSFCLMPNHFHFVLRTPDGDLDKGMHALLGEHVRRLHRRCRTAGPVMRGRYGARLLETDEHLLEVLRYVPLNPCRSGLGEHPSLWPWSSHRALAGEAPPLDVLDVQAVYALLEASTGAGGPAGYRRLLASAKDGRDVRPFPRTVGIELDPDLRELLGQGSPQEIATAHDVHGHSVRVIASCLGCSRETVRRRLREARSEPSRRRSHDEAGRGRTDAVPGTGSSTVTVPCTLQVRR